MLFLLYITNTKSINKYFTIFCMVLIVLTIFYFPPISAIYILDMYIYLLRNNFLLTESQKKSNDSSVTMDITAEGIKKEYINIKSLLIDYSNKFDD